MRGGGESIDRPTGGWSARLSWLECPAIYLSICLSIYLSIYLALVYLSNDLSVYLSICLSVYLSQFLNLTTSKV